MSIQGTLGNARIVQDQSKADPSALTSILSELDSRIGQADNLASRLCNAMDFVAGPAPTPPTVHAGNSNPPGTSPGMVGNAQDKLHSLYLLLDRIDDGVRRLERVVG